MTNTTDRIPPTLPGGDDGANQQPTSGSGSAGVSQKENTAPPTDRTKVGDPHATRVYSREELAQLDQRLAAEVVDSTLAENPAGHKPLNELTLTAPPIIKRGAGGTKTIPHSRSLMFGGENWLTYFKQWQLLGVIVFLTVLFGVFAWIFLREKSLRTVATVELRVVDPGMGAIWLQGDETVQIENRIELPAPRQGLPVQVVAGVAPLSIQLFDETQLSLAPKTSVSFLFSETALDRLLIQIEDGTMLVVGTATIQNPLAHSAKVTRGNMGVIFRESPFYFVVDCFSGECTTGKNTQALPSGKRTEVGKDGRLLFPGLVQHEHYIVFSVVATSTPTFTPTAMPILTNTPILTVTPTVTPTRTPIPTPEDTPTSTPTETPEISEVPPITINGFSCNAGEVITYKTSSVIEFSFNWAGRLASNQYVEILTGPRGSNTTLNYTETVPPERRIGNTWTIQLSIPQYNIYNPNWRDYHWQVRVMERTVSGNTFPVRFSGRRCFSISD
jgi:cell division septation protein DedD